RCSLAPPLQPTRPFVLPHDDGEPQLPLLIRTGPLSAARSPPLPYRPPLLDERPLRLARILAAAERRADLLLALVGLGEREMHDLAHAPAGLAHRERRVGGDRGGRVERGRHERGAGNEPVHGADARARPRGGGAGG